MIVAAAMSSAWAQDVIVTQDSQRIDAKVTEISDSEVRYQRADNPDGPIFVISTERVASIVFSNGEVKTFNKPASQQNSSFEVDLSDGSNTITFVPGQKITRSGFDYYYGRKLLTSDVYSAFLRKTCPEAERHYSSHQASLYTGHILLALGVTVFGVGAYLSDKEKLNGTDMHSSAYLIGGGVSMAFSLVLYISSFYERGMAIQIFNEKCSNTPQRRGGQSLTMYAAPTGVSLTYNF